MPDPTGSPSPASVDELRKKILDANGKVRLRKFLNSLALKPKRTCRTLHCCQLCACEIRLGDEYRDGGYGRRAHEYCFQACNREIT
jgi:hypothetical protein